MPKAKNHSGAGKRFKKTSSGKYKHKQSHARHILTKKSAKRKRQLRGKKALEHCHEAAVKQMLPNGL